MLAEVILDVLPWPGRSRDRGTEVLGRVLPDRVHIPETDTPGAIKRALNETHWIDGEVVAAGDVRQGMQPSLVAMLTGVALIEVLRPELFELLAG